MPEPSDREKLEKRAARGRRSQARRIFSAMLWHLRFVRDHHRQIRRIAVVSDNKILGVASRTASHFVSAQVRSFDAGNRAAARVD